MNEEVDCVQQNDGMDEEPRNDQEPGESSVVLVGCQTDITLRDLNEPEAALVKVKDLETALSAAKKVETTQAQLKKQDDCVQVADHELLGSNPNVIKLYTG